MAYLSISNWHEFQREVQRDGSGHPGSSPGQTIYTSPVLTTPIGWTEVVPSWNIRSTNRAGYQFELRPVYPGRTSPYFHLGHWSARPDEGRPRHSINGQSNEIGTVQTDTLIVKKPCRQIQVRITVTGDHPPDSSPPVDFLGLDLFDARQAGSLEAEPTSRRDSVLHVPERSQLSHPGGRDWCSPTSVSMILAYWAGILKRPELDRAIQDVAAGVHDPQWPGTGNWAFNAAFAGHFPGLRAQVTRLRNTAELERWIQAGVPPAVSVSFDLLNGKPRDEGTGHLVVCVGTTATGDFIINDPFAVLKKGERVRRTISRQTLAKAWRRSNGVVYLIYPESWTVPVLHSQE